MISTAILTINDKGYNNQRDDLTDPAIKDILPIDKFSVEYYKIIPDEVEMIK
jgi:molybdopterin biosynthesis enzyme MoaB